MDTGGTKADEISLAIEEAIVLGELTPGSVLRQEQLSDRYGVSRTPVREALRRLEALGLVSFEANRGFRVRTLLRQEMWEAFLVRAELESLITGIAAEKVTEEDLAELEQAEQRFSRLARALRARWRPKHSTLRPCLDDAIERPPLRGWANETNETIPDLRRDRLHR